MAGEFLLKFFEERQEVIIKPNGEANVLCPFPHGDGYYEKNPSAHINIEKGVFHCKTCAAEGRFSKGGLSEAGFIMRYYNISYTEAVKLLAKFQDNSDGVEEESWDKAVENLLSNQDAMDYLSSRGITKDVVIEYRLGYDGDGILYPVFVNGVMLDKRKYRFKRQEGEPKITSEKGASALLFPFDHWKNDDRTTILTAGENDTLLARKLGFNAVTSTFGEGSFPTVFLGMFKGRDVIICYDCDEAGREGALKVAFLLYEAEANSVRIADLGLSGTKDDKDLTDFIIKHNRTAEDLYHILFDESKVYDGESYKEDKNKHYPLVDLWKVPHGEYAGKYISSRVMMMGRYDMPMEVPVAVEWACTCPSNSEKAPCQWCPLKNKSGWWTLDDENLHQVLELVEVTNSQQDKALNRFIGVPEKCPGITKVKREKKHVQKVIFAPDVESEHELTDYRAVEHQAYVIGNDLEDGQRYRIYFKRYPHPKNQAIVSVVDRVEYSDNAINTFKVDEEMIKQLSQFQGDPYEVMDKRYELAKKIIGNYVKRQVVDATNIMYHSVLDFKYGGKYMKGHPEGLIIGESRTGKTDPTKMMIQFIGLGNITDCKAASTAGLLGGADKLPSGGHRIRWGKIPRNHRGLLVLDEISGMPREVFATLTALRSERRAVIEKIVSGAAPAKTRLLWMGNPRVHEGKSKPIIMYPTGVDIVIDLIGSDEDVARFDFVIILPPNRQYISPFENGGTAEIDIDPTPYRNLVYWAWSRNADQVKFDKNVEVYIWQVAQELNEKYDCDVKFFGAEAHKKLARIAVSVAVCCFSHDGTGESVLVKKEHVDWARDFLVNCYDNDIFRLRDYVEQRRMLTTTNEEINNVFAQMLHSKPLLMKTLSRVAEISLFQLQTICGMERQEFSEAIANLVRHGLLETTKNGVMPTERFKLARNAYLNNVEKQKMTPLSQQGGIPI